MKNLIITFILSCTFMLSISAYAQNFKYMVFSEPGDTLMTSGTGELGSDNIAHRISGNISWYLNATNCKDASNNQWNFNSLKNVVVLGLNTWENEPNSSVDFDNGTSTAIADFAADGKNVLFWITNNHDLYNFYFNEYARALTATTTHESDPTIIVESDICFNGEDYRWTDDYSEASFENGIAGIQAITTHEIGHMLGFHHNSISTSVMEGGGYDFDDAWHTLGPDDCAAVAFVYGGSIINNITLINGSYFFDWDITIPSGKTLTLVGYGADATMYMAPGKYIYVNGTLSLPQSRSKITKDDESKWGGIVVNSGGTLSVTGNNIIEEAVTGIHTYGVTPAPISVSSGDSLIVKNCSSSGIHIHNSSPTLSRIHIENVSAGYGGILIEGSTSNPTLQDITVKSSLYGINEGNYADANVYWNHLYSNSSHCINLGTAAELNMENAGYGYNALYPGGGCYAINNNSTNGYINADNNYWGTPTPTGALFGDSNYINDFNDHLDNHPSGAGASKQAAYTNLDALQQAIVHEEAGEFDRAYSEFRDIFLSSSDPQIKRRSLKFMLRIKDKTTREYADLKRLVADEQIIYLEHDSYRAILDYFACELPNREGKTAEAIAAFDDMSKNYEGTSMEVEMLCRIAELYGGSDDRDNAREYAARAASLNPGQLSLKSAFAAAGVNYDPFEFENRYADGSGHSKPAESADNDDSGTQITNILTITPNPANPFTTINYTLAKPGNVSLDIYSISGQKVATLVDGAMTAGTHSAVFDGSSLASGIYLYRFRTAGFAKSGKIALVK